MRAWKDCPTCNGFGRMAQHPGSAKSQLPVTETLIAEGWRIVPCPTCAAHFKAMDELRAFCSGLIARMGRELDAMDSELIRARKDK